MRVELKRGFLQEARHVRSMTWLQRSGKHQNIGCDDNRALPHNNALLSSGDVADMIVRSCPAEVHVSHPFVPEARIHP